MYKARMIREFEDLCEKIGKLDSFLEKEDTENSGIDSKKFEMMKAQINFMCQYRDILGERILLEIGGIENAR